MKRRDFLAAGVALPALQGIARLGRAEPAGPTAARTFDFDERFDALVRLAETRMRDLQIPGAALGVIKNGQLQMRALGVTNIDDDTAAVKVSVLSGTQTTELGGKVSFKIVLGSRPAGTSSVSIPISSSNTAEAEPDKTLVTFTTANWNVEQTVTFTGQEAPTALISDTTRLQARLGPPPTPLDRVLRWTAHWVRHGGRLLNKPTHFEVRDGKY